MMLSKLRCAVLGIAFASHLFASPCITDTLANYILLNGSGGCTVNSEPVAAFAFSVGATSVGLSTMSASNIMVAPSFTSNSYQLLFFATGSTSSTGFVVSGSQFVNYEIDFTWDPVVVGAEDQMDANSPTFPGTATVNTSLCAGSTFGVGCPPATNTLHIYDDGHTADNILTATTSFAPVTTVGTQSVISLYAYGSTSEITGFSTSVLIPEPGAMVFAASGLLALMLRRLCAGRKPSL